MIDSKETFLEFLRALTSDWDTHEAEWENGTIPDFLSACCSWSEATCALAGKRHEEHRLQGGEFLGDDLNIGMRHQAQPHGEPPGR